MYKIFKLSSLVFTLLFLGSTFVFADSDFSALMVDANGSTTAKSAFGLGEVPWLWTSKTNTSDGELFHSIFATWYIVDTVNSTLNYKGFSVIPTTTQKDSWLTLSGYDWSSISAPVEYWQTVVTLNSIHAPVYDQKSASFLCSECSSDTKCLSFTRYVPEPISVALFLLGGSALGLGVLRKRKKV